MIDENEGSEASLVGEFGVCPEPMSAFAQELALVATAWTQMSRRRPSSVSCCCVMQWSCTTWCRAKRQHTRHCREVPTRSGCRQSWAKSSRQTKSSWTGYSTASVGLWRLIWALWHYRLNVYRRILEKYYGAEFAGMYVVHHEQCKMGPMCRQLLFPLSIKFCPSYLVKPIFL